MKISQILSVLFIAFLILSCNEENPLLVNPPSKSETVRLRFINLGIDQKSKILDFEGIKTPEIPYALSSEGFKPAADSAMIKVFSGSAVEFELQQQVKFIRKTNYTFVGLSSKVTDNPSANKIDTLITLRTAAALPDNPLYTLVKLFNAFPDTNVRYTIRLGCPNGEQIFTPLLYKQYSINPSTILTGKFSISLTKITTTGTLKETFINLYELTIDPLKQYTIIVTMDDKGKEKLLLLNEDDLSSTALKEVNKVTDRNSYIRTINLSSTNINVSKEGTNITSGLNSMYIDKFQSVEVCSNLSKDTIITSVGGTTQAKNPVALEVAQKYSLIVFDSANVAAKKSLLIEPLKLIEKKAGKATVRVVNAAKNFPKLTVSLGARKDTGNTISTGLILADSIYFGETNKPVNISEGIAPICIFTTSQPSKLIYSARGKLEMNKSYLLIITNDEKGKILATLIDDLIEQSGIEYINEGVFVQLVNAYKGLADVKITFNSQSGELPILQDSKVAFNNSIATVIEPKSQTINVEGINYTFDAELNKRILIVITGDSKNIQIISDKFEPMGSELKGLLRFRFVNAATDIPITKIKTKDNDSADYVDAIEYKLFGSYNTENKQRNITYYFYDNDGKKYILRLNDVILNIDKSYSIILTGYTTPSCYREYDKNKSSIEPNCYEIIVQQEF